MLKVKIIDIKKLPNIISSISNIKEIGTFNSEFYRTMAYIVYEE